MIPSFDVFWQSLDPSIDAALILSPVNRRYMSGFASSAGCVFLTRSEGYFLTDFRYMEAARARVKNLACMQYERLRDTLQSLVQKHNVRIMAIERDFVTCAGLSELQNALPGIDLTGALDEILSRLRRIKSPGELALIREAARLGDAAFDHILICIAAGVTEREIALELEFFMRREGAEAASFDTIVAAGANGSRPHGVPTDRVLRPGDFITMDFGAVMDGYHSDMTRTVALGTPSDEQRAVYDLVRRAQKAAAALVKPGAMCDICDAAARDMIDAAGYQDCFGHGTGHGVGLEIHEEPRLSTACTDALAFGNVVTVEPGIYVAGRFGVRIEDMLFVTRDGSETLTKSPKELIIL